MDERQCLYLSTESLHDKEHDTRSSFKLIVKRDNLSAFPPSHSTIKQTTHVLRNDFLIIFLHQAVLMKDNNSTCPSSHRFNVSQGDKRHIFTMVSPFYQAVVRERHSL